jgi:hypothetical protein
MSMISYDNHLYYSMPLFLFLKLFTLELATHNGFSVPSPDIPYGNIHVNFTLDEASIVILNYKVSRSLGTSGFLVMQVVGSDEMTLIQSADTAVRAGNMKIYSPGGPLITAQGFMVLSLNAGSHSYYLRYRSNANLDSTDSSDAFYTVESFMAVRMPDATIHTQNYHNPDPSYTLVNDGGAYPSSNVWPDTSATVTVSEATPTLIHFRYAGDIGSLGRSCGFGPSCSASSNTNKWIVSSIWRDDTVQDMGKSVHGFVPWGMVEFMQVGNLAAGSYNYDVRYRTNAASPKYFPESDYSYLGMTILQFPTATVLTEIADLSAWTVTTASSWTAVPGLTDTFTLADDDLVLLQYQFGFWDGSHDNDFYMTMFVDSVEVTEMRSVRDGSGNYAQGFGAHFVPMTAGSHTIEVRYRASSINAEFLSQNWPDYVTRSMSAIALNTTLAAQDVQNGVTTCPNNSSEPIAPTSQATLSASRFVLTVNYSGEFDSYFNVTFPDSSLPGYCDFSSLDADANSLWTATHTESEDDTTSCMNYLTLNVTTAAMLGNCGFSQDNVREPGRTHFLNTISLLTGQQRVEQRDDDRQLIRVVTRETQIPLDIAISTNTTAVTSEILVKGVPVRTEGLKDLTIVVGPDGNDYTYTVEGEFITDVQFPYRLEEPAVMLGDMFLASTAALTPNTYCDQVDGFVEEQICTQVWSFTAQIDPAVACVTSDFLSEFVNVTFGYNCTDVFEGECFPNFPSNDASFYLYSAEFCPTYSNIPLEAEMTLYAYAPSGGSTASQPADGAFVSTAQNAPGSDFVEEATFVYESTVFGEVRAIVPDAASTLSSTTIKLIKTIPDDNTFSTKVVYDDLQDQAAGVSGGNVIVNNTGFGTTEEQPTGDIRAYSDARARFQFDWNANTADRENTPAPTAESDAAAGFSVSVLIEVTFAPASLSSYDESGDDGDGDGDGDDVVDSTDAGRELLNRMHANEHTKSARVTVELFADSDGRSRSFGVVGRASISGTQSVAGPTAATSSSGGFIASPAAVAVGAAVVGVALVALVAFVVFRRSEPSGTNNTISKTQLATGTLPASSSGVELSGFAVTLANHNYYHHDNGNNMIAIQTLGDVQQMYASQ